MALWRSGVQLPSGPPKFALKANAAKRICANFGAAEAMAKERHRHRAAPVNVKFWKMHSPENGCHAITSRE